MAKSPYLPLLDLQGGINENDAPFAIGDTEVVSAVNVDYRYGKIGSKRGGLVALALTGSVFETLVPKVGVTITGNYVASAAPSVVVPPYGVSSTNLFLVVMIGRGATGAVVNVPTFRGVPMTLIGGTAGVGSTDVYCYYTANPNIAGGTVAVTIGAASDGFIVATTWDNVNVAASPLGLFVDPTVIGAANPLIEASNAFTPKHMVISAVGTTAAITATPSTGAGTVFTQPTLVSGAARMTYSYCIGMKPTTEFVYNLVGGGLYGAILFGLTGAAGAEPLRAIMRFTRTNRLTDDELWLQDDWGRLDRRVAGVWQGGVPTINYQIGSTSSPTDYSTYETNGASLHGKFFLALGGSLLQNRLNMWDPATGVLRWAGIAAPQPPTGANTAPAGAFAGTRYYRMRYIEVINGKTTRRSEPSTVLTFAPSGANSGVVVTKPASGGFMSGEGETHWELEASVDNVTFYLLATTIVATTTVTDTTVFATGYSTGSNLSPSLTEYNVPTAPRHIVVDEDRILFGGNTLVFGLTLDASLDSRVNWTPLSADTGVGNDERVPATSRFFLDLDGLSGGQLQHLLAASFGGIYVFKQARIYKLSRNGVPAYASVQFSDTRGCVSRAAHNGTDLGGNPCVYFNDPNVGLCRVGTQGVVDLMQKMTTTVQRINQSAHVISRVLFYPKHWLVWMSAAVDAGVAPTLMPCLNLRSNGWTTYDGVAASMVGGVLFPDQTTLKLRPYVITDIAALGVGGVGTSYLFEADNGVNDAGTRFAGRIVSKAFIPGGLFQQVSVDGAVLHARISAASVEVAAVRDVGAQTVTPSPVSLAALGTETYRTAPMDNVTIGECYLVQFALGDPVSYAGAQLDQTWTLEGLVVKAFGGTETG